MGNPVSRQNAQAMTLAAVSIRAAGDLLTPVSVFLRLAGDGPAFLLESAEGEIGSARHSIVGFDPLAILTCLPDGNRITHADGSEEGLPAADPAAALTAFVARYAVDGGPEEGPFPGGAVGYLSYEAASTWERLPLAGGRYDDLPLAQFIIPRTTAVLDRLTGVMTLTRLASPTEGGREEAERELGRLVGLLAATPSHPSIGVGERAEDAIWTDSLSREEFESSVGRVLEDIRGGEILQAVLSIRKTAPFLGDPFTIYRHLRLLNPSPYLFFLRLPGCAIAGSSPEMMVRLRGEKMMVKPIAGTRPRGADAAEDDILVAELVASEKERAEHAMLVDLGRNDLGRVAAAGSVRVERIMEVESFSRVHHLVSRVTGTLRREAGVADLIRSVFPAGTVSGAPKIRAMEIIAREEPVPRGPYAGLAGYLGFDGNFDCAIVIRSAVVAGGAVRVQAGAGIVADSDPAAEYLEIASKAGAVLEAVRRANGGNGHAAADR